MKALFIILVVVLLLAGGGFFFGWIQILLSPETYAVIFTKTGGYDDTVTYPGHFSWRWERLLPTNMTLLKFQLQPQRSDITHSGSLPSGEFYSSILPEKPNFSFEVRISIVFELNPESLPRLVIEEKLTPGTLAGYYQQQTSMIARKVLELGKENAFWSEASSMKTFTNELSMFFPDLRLQQVDAYPLQVPDMSLYNLAKDSYRNLVAIWETSRKEAAVGLAEEIEQNRIDAEREENTLDRLRRYGELFTEYPILVKVLYMQQSESGLQLPEFELPEILESSSSE
ncbi:MAG TPA: hypothetical protein ENI27_06930 [bacterium]|nr:hypothetical protein [bacterium]